MNKLIDEIINQVTKGREIPTSGIEYNGSNFSSYMGQLIKWDGAKPTSICTMSYFFERTRELGWINGYKWGEEYPTNGEDPDLPDDTKVTVLSLSGEGVNYGSVAKSCWATSISFKITDERYKPVAEQSAASKDDPLGDLPPIGSILTLGAVERDGEPDVRYTYDVEVVLHRNGKIVVCRTTDGKEHYFAIDRKEFHKQIEIQQLKTKRDQFIEDALALDKSRGYGVRPDIYGNMFDEGFRAPEGK